MGVSFDCAIPPVEFRDLAACEDHRPYSVLGCWQEADRVSGERLGRFEGLSLEADPSLLLDTANLMYGGVLDERQGFREGVWTRRVAYNRLRKKLGDPPRKPELIHTVAGFGYRLSVR